MGEKEAIGARTPATGRATPPSGAAPRTLTHQRPKPVAPLPRIAAAQEETRAVLSQLVASMSLFYGVAYTVLLLAAFVPCIVSLSGTARRLTQVSGNEPSNYELLARTGLRFSLMGDLRQFGILLGPLVAAVSASLVEFVGN